MKRTFILPLVTLALVVSAVAAFAQDPVRELRMQVEDAVKLYKDDNLAGATDAFEALYAKHPGDKDVQAWLGFLYLRGGKAVEAVPILEKAMEQRPGDLEVMNNLGNAYLATDKLDMALAKYAQMTELKPNMPEPWYNIGNIHLRQSNWEAGVRAYKRALDLRPGEEAYIHNNLGVAYEKLGNLEESASSFARASNRSPESAVYARNAGFAYLKAKVNKPASAKPFLQRAYALNPKDPPVAMALANVYTGEGKDLDALKIYETLGDELQNDPKFWYNLGVLRGKMGDRHGAHDAYHKAYELNPDDPDTLNNLGLMLYESEAYDRAAPLFERLVGLDANSVNAKINLAATLSKVDRRDEAVALWKEILHLHPSNSSVRLNLANALWQQKDYEAAKYHYNQVLMIEKNQGVFAGEAQNGLGLYELQGARLVEAEAAFRASIRLHPKFGPAYNNLAVVLERSNKRAEAIKILERGLFLDPENADIRSNLARMKAAG